MPNVEFEREELKKIKPLYNKIRDCIDGPDAVKKGREKYLPVPCAEDESEENLIRYENYLIRAVFYNVTARTLNGFVGEMFKREPTLKLPALLEIIQEDANGDGVTLVQSCKRAAFFTLGWGRAGVFTDYPNTGEGASRRQIKEGDIRPTINIYEPWRVINWRTKTRGAKQVLSLIVLKEQYIISDDGFEVKHDWQYRVLRLGKSEENKEGGLTDSEDVYTVEVWQKQGGKLGIAETYQPRDAKGQLLDEIPFTFLGCENNDSIVDNPPLGDLAELNIAHYRNSADYEEACFITGQPTLIISGLTEDWYKEVLKGKIRFGSRGGIPLNKDGDAKLLQAEANTMPFEGMAHKERQMVAIGAKIVEQATVQRTATETVAEASSENSILISVANNISAAIRFSLEWCAIFQGADENSVEFDINTDFELTSLSSEERKQTISEWQAGAISFTEMRDRLRKGGVATIDDDKVKVEIEQAQQAELALMEKQTKIESSVGNDE